MPPDQMTFSRDELCRLLRMTAPAVDALLASGAIPVTEAGGEKVVNGADLERWFAEALQQLGEAREQRQRERSDARAAARYSPRRQLSGMFREIKVQVLQLSASGLRIRHNEAVRPGEEARLSVALPQAQKSCVMRARVVWTSLAQTGAGETFFISGLRVTANEERVAEVMDVLRESHDLQLAPSDDRRRKPREVPGVMNGVADEDVAAIIRAVRKFAADPAEATRWYTRARFAVIDANVRNVAPRGGREREEVLGIWEYLQRRVDIATVTGVLRWIRSSQANA